jgi:FtsP/CotA-like multicopper oxidase with cupredoxin domain
MREVVPVSPGITYKFRILNAGSMYALRISFDGIKMTIVAADSEQVEPVIADEIIVHAAERFDVEVAIPEDAEIGSTRWIRADTLESRKQGYQNGIRAILRVVDPNKSDKIDSASVPDPETAIETTIDHSQQLTYNCYSHVETKEKRGEGGCIPVSALRLKDGGTSRAAKIAAEAAFVPYEAHVIDWQFRYQ